MGRPLVGPQCAVCGEEAPLNGPYRRHYGVICCEACKCFFRRTVQMNKQYECKLTGNCAVGKNVRHWCQACRFQKCLSSGMKIDGESVCVGGGGDVHACVHVWRPPADQDYECSYTLSHVCHVMVWLYVQKCISFLSTSCHERHRL